MFHVKHQEVKMAARKKKQPEPRRGRGGWIALGVIGVMALMLGGLMGYGALNANTVHVRHASVAVEDLPAAFEGKSILFVSDIDLCGWNTPEKAGKLFNRLQALNPDILLLGGDYASESIIDVLNRSDETQTSDGELIRARTNFFNELARFSAPLGKYAVAGDNDAQAENLAQTLTQCGIQPLFNNRAEIPLNGDKIYLVGINYNTEGVNFNGVGNAFNRDDCVIALTHSPAAFPQMITAEARDSGAWVDLALAGHTHGGQIRLFGRNIIRLTAQEQHYLYGWFSEGSAWMLTSSGLGCEGANIRIGSKSEVWMIELRRKAQAPLIPDLN